MKKLILAIVAAGIAAASASPALAAQGCGAGWHRGYYGRCVPNRPPRVYHRPMVEGRYYRDRDWRHDRHHQRRDYRHRDWRRH